jgi:hypothetical protein
VKGTHHLLCSLLLLWYSLLLGYERRINKRLSLLTIFRITARSYYQNLHIANFSNFTSLNLLINQTVLPICQTYHHSRIIKSHSNVKRITISQEEIMVNVLFYSFIHEPTHCVCLHHPTKFHQSPPTNSSPRTSKNPQETS